MRKSIAACLTMVMIMAMFLTGCGSSGNEDAAGGEGATYKLTMSSTAKSEFCMNKAGQDFINYVEEKSEGRIQIEFHEAGILGTDRETLEATAMGDQDLVLTTPFQTNQVSNIAGWLFLDTPYVVTDKDVWYEMQQGEAFAALINQTAESARLRVLGMGDLGPLGCNSTNPITSPDDMKSMKLRAAEIKTTIDFMKAMGVQTSVVAYTELYTAMQQGLMDGSLSTTNLMYDAGTYEYGKFITELGTGWSGCMVEINEDLYQSLSDEDKAIFDEAGKIFSEASRKYSEEEYAERVAKMEQTGVTVKTLTEEEMSAFYPYAEEVYKEWSVNMGNFWTSIMTELETLGYESPARGI